MWLPLLLPLCALDPSAHPTPALQRAPKNSSGGELLPEEAAYDVRWYDLRLRVDPDARTIDGTLTMTAVLVAASDAIVFDLGDELELRAVRLNGEPATYERGEAQRVRVVTEALEGGTSFELAVDYGGTPRTAPNPPWRGGFTWEETADGQPWIATSCQGEGADLWWPCKDHPSDEPDGMDLAITVPEPLVVASNGRLVGSESDDGWTTWRWRVSTPIANYVVALNIAPYVTISEPFESVSGETFEMTYWVLPENREQGEEIFPEFREHLAFFEQLLGPYPFRGDKYGVAETPHLGMEHQTIIGYGNRYRGDPNFDYDWLHHHELAHEWWANLVTARDWSDFWIHEGIGTYMQALYLERKFGFGEATKKLALDSRGIRNQGAVAPGGERETSWMYFASSDRSSPGNDIYYKGGYLCHTLRWLLGDETFFRVLRRWAYPDPELEATTDGSACRLTSTEELIEIAERVSERELDWFFELYLRQPALPRLVSERDGDQLRLAWETPEGMPFPMPVEIEVDGERRRVEVGEDGGTATVGTGDVAIDPDDWILRDS